MKQLKNALLSSPFKMFLFTKKAMISHLIVALLHVPYYVQYLRFWMWQIISLIFGKEVNDIL